MNRLLGDLGDLGGSRGRPKTGNLPRGGKDPKMAKIEGGKPKKQNFFRQAHVPANGNLPEKPPTEGWGLGSPMKSCS